MLEIDNYTQEQALRWFRDKGYRYGINWDPEEDKYFFDVWAPSENTDFKFQFIFESEWDYNTYEAAETECLSKLIQTYKNINNEK